LKKGEKKENKGSPAQQKNNEEREKDLGWSKGGEEERSPG